MPRNEATLRINIGSRGNPACSICGTQFGSEGLVRDLIEAFAFHVRRQHSHSITSYTTAREPVSPAFARVKRKASVRR
jgi:hypothetical protein